MLGLLQRCCLLAVVVAGIVVDTGVVEAAVATIHIFVGGSFSYGCFYICCCCAC